MELNEPDLNNLDRLIAHRVQARASSPGISIIACNAAPVKPPSTFISDEGETVVSQVRQIQKHLSEREVAQIVLDYQNGISMNNLADEFGCDRHTICDHLKKHGIKVSHNKIKSEEAVRRIVMLYEDGHMIEEIADQYDVSQTTINRLLRKHGVRIRSRWDYEKQ